MGLIMWSDFSVIWNVTKRMLDASLFLLSLGRTSTSSIFEWNQFPYFHFD